MAGEAAAARHTLVLVELYAVDAEEGDTSPESFANHAAAVETRKVMAQALLHSGSAKNGFGQLKVAPSALRVPASLHAFWPCTQRS